MKEKAKKTREAREGMAKTEANFAEISKDFQVYMSSIHIDFGIEDFVQKHCYGSFSGPHKSHASTV